MSPHPKPVPFTHERWRTNVRKSALLAAAISAVSLAIGVLGYRFLGPMKWVDAILEASMILGGMGPVATMNNDAIKLFASFYALFAGLMLITTTSILLAPWMHRLFYHTHRQATCDAIETHEKESKK
jgi:hypothetical protein